MRASDDLVCCPVCDALHEIGEVPEGARLRCVRCNTVLAVDRPEAVVRIVVLSLTALILMSIVIFFPFLELRKGVFDSQTSVFRTAMSFDQGVTAPLSIAVTAFVMVLPVMRLMALVWTFGPLSINRRPLPGAARMLRLAGTLRPWAMDDVFMIGVAVALVKLSGLATLSVGPAFWSFAGIVFITAVMETQMNKNSLWTALSTASQR